jgi:cell division protein ZapE
MTPEAVYQKDIKAHGFTADAIQAQAVQLTHSLFLQLLKPPRKKPHDSVFQRLWQRVQQTLSLTPAHNPIKGLYLWGGVGRGKTWLMDSFYNALPFEEKQRIHFHPFMQVIHEQLRHLPKTPDPLTIIAQQMSLQYRVLCIDEFHVQDITDAMLLAGLLEALFSHHVTLVTTSNIAPDDLYKNGLQRTRFLPAIELIKQHTRVFELNNTIDYRDLVLAKEGCYHTPLNQHNDDMMLQHYIQLTDHAPVEQSSIEINNRDIKVVAVNFRSQQHPKNVVWFDFNELCNTHRSNSDYQLIARQFKHLLIANAYSMDEEKEDVAKRFMHLIDALYDNQCYLVISAETQPDALYHGRLLRQPFQRTVSRLHEMRSKPYQEKTNI